MGISEAAEHSARPEEGIGGTKQTAILHTGGGSTPNILSHIFKSADFLGQIFLSALLVPKEFFVVQCHGGGGPTTTPLLDFRSAQHPTQGCLLPIRRGFCVGRQPRGAAGTHRPPHPGPAAADRGHELTHLQRRRGFPDVPGRPPTGGHLPHLGVPHGAHRERPGVQARHRPAEPVADGHWAIWICR